MKNTRKVRYKGEKRLITDLVNNPKINIHNLPYNLIYQRIISTSGFNIEKIFKTPRIGAGRKKVKRGRKKTGFGFEGLTQECIQALHGSNNDLLRCEKLRKSG